MHDRRTKPGISESIQEALAAVGAYLVARFELLKVEAGEAGGRIVKVAVAAAVAVLCAAIGYVAVWVGLIAWAAGRWFEGAVAVPTLIAAGVHLAAAVGLAAWAWSAFIGRNFFVATRQELLEDQQWLTDQQKSKR